MSYPGGKGGEGIAQRIINEMPPHLVYVEPCLGGGAVLRAKLPALLSIGCDLSGAALDAFRGGGGSVELIHACGVEFVARAFGLVDHDWVSNGPAGLWFRHGGRRYPAGRVVIYWDPPYPHETRSKKRIYEHEWDDEQHDHLLELTQKIGALQMISTYQNKRYAAALQGWRRLRYQAQTRRGMRTEELWCNFPAGGPLHDYRFLGRNRREREKIRRRRRNWRRGLARMPQRERLAVLAELAEAFRAELCFESAEQLSRSLGGIVFPPAATLDVASRYPTPESAAPAADA